MTEETINPDPVSDPVPPHSAAPEEGAHPRGKWADKKEFLFSMAAQIINQMNLSYFPYMCYVHGGCVFLIPYCFFLFFLGLPLFFLETAVGQYTSLSGPAAWKKICPMFQGIGFASLVILGFLNIYHIIILAWILFYLYNSFKSPLPWTTCNNWWNTDLCSPDNFNATSVLEDTLFEATDEESWNLWNKYSAATKATEEFWILRTLRRSDDVPITALNWHLAVCLLIAWILCYFCVWKGIRILGKVVYFTVPFSYLLLFIFFIRGVTLEGAGEGLKYFLLPDLSRITSIHIWMDALRLVVSTYCLSIGVLTPLGSYNKYNNNCYRDCLLLMGLHFATSIFAGFVVFSVVGFLAGQLDVSTNEVRSSGISLVFETFPHALSMLTGSNVWSVLFFLMMLSLNLNTQFICIESLATAIADLFPRCLRRPCARELLVLAIAVVCFLLGLSLVTKGGTHLLDMISFYTGGVNVVVFVACFEALCIAWVYGADRFYDNIEDMIGYPPFPVLKYCWLFISPLICTVLIHFYIAQFIGFHPFQDVPVALRGTLGCLLLTITLMCIPVCIFVALCKNSRGVTTPSRDLRQSRPHLPILTLCKRVIFKAQPSSRDGEHEKMMMGEAERA